ncbi:hypothetical protein T4B_7708 [Trichinella pseudospiralis]|uniref:Uncharacterized protein n=1 Tax=Trichinella pseudospiralis TaxID=6337 RepID=A0A0V1H6C4_TRIPS|nr:hypothetical protein T4B_7708 [Trichinella pseudospiralis]
MLLRFQRALNEGFYVIKLTRASLGFNGTQQNSLVVFRGLKNSDFAITSAGMPPHRHLSKPLTGRSTNLKSGGSRPSHQETHDTMHFKMPSNVAAAIERIRKFTTALTNVPTFHLLENDTRKDAYVAMEDLTATLLRLVAVDDSTEKNTGIELY